MLSSEYLQGMPTGLVELYSQVENDILADMARRIDGFDLYIPAAQYQAQVLQEMGMLQSEITEILASMTSKTTAELTAIMKTAGVEAVSGDLTTYAAAGLTVTSSVSDSVQQVLAAGLEKTAGLFTNLTSTTANTASQQFEAALDKAYMKVSSGAFDSTSAVTSAIKELSAQGVGAITYPSGHVDTLEVAVRRATITGVNQTCGKVQEALAKELGCDLVEVSAHAGAREEHAQWQGQIYSLSGKSEDYPSLVEVTGYGTGAGLMGWNCSHSFAVYIEGFPRAFSDKQLKEYEAKTCNYNGVAMTQSEAQAKQRYIERNIRKYTREANALTSVGLDASKEKAKIAEWNATLGDFVSQTGQKVQAGRTVVGTASQSKTLASLVGLQTSNGITVMDTIHIADQIVSRDVSVLTIKAALTNPLKITTIKLDDQGRPSQQLIGEKATVAVNPESGNLITVWKTSSKLAKKLKEGTS